MTYTIPEIARYGYDEGDRCWWTTNFTIPRGQLIDAELQFDAFPRNLLYINIFELKFYINDINIYYTGSYDLLQDCGWNWKTFTIPLGLWVNDTDVFTNPVNNTEVSLNVSLEHTSGSDWWVDFENRTYQQVYIDNVKLITKAEVQTDQIGLKMNQTSINNNGWGKGDIELTGNWQTDNIYCNFTSDEIWGLSNYQIDLKMDSNIFAIQNTPETNYETNYNSLGTKYSVINNSAVEWESYAYLSVPLGYEETEMQVEFPSDLNITWISSPQDPSTNTLSQCDNATLGILKVPVHTISTTPNGYWKLKGISPNYCNQLTIYKNGTNNPLDDIWNTDSSFLSGDYINITADIYNSPLVSSYIDQTTAHLYIKFPNGTIWTSMSQLKNPNSTGGVSFDYFQIPNSEPYYEEGEYEVIITWNNSYSGFGINETGIIYSTFLIIHDSDLTPDQGEFYIPNIIEDRFINLKVSFNDDIDNNAIENAYVYTNFKSVLYNFSEISPGFYFLEF